MSPLRAADALRRPPEPGPVRRLVVVSGGISVPSTTRLLADRLAAAARAAMEAVGERVVLEVVELRELAHAMTDQLLTGVPAEAVERAQRSLAAADAVVAVTPVYVGSYAGLFKTFVDLLPRGTLTGTPVLLGATAGSARHSLALDQALRPLFAQLGALTTPTGVLAATSDFGHVPGEPGGPDLAERIARAGGELARLVRLGDLDAPTRARSVADHPTQTVGESAALTPFERMLAGRA